MQEAQGSHRTASRSFPCRAHPGGVRQDEPALTPWSSPRAEEAVAAALGHAGRLGESDAATPARVVSAVLFLARAASVNAAASVDEILHGIRDQPAVVLPR